MELNQTELKSVEPSNLYFGKIYSGDKFEKRAPEVRGQKQPFECEGSEATVWRSSSK